MGWLQKYLFLGIIQVIFVPNVIDAGEKGMQVPIVLFVYNRVEHAKSVLEALNENFDADKSELFIFSDAPADITEEPNVQSVRDFLEEFKENNRFKRIIIFYAEKNKGLENSLIGGITQIIDQYGSVIVLEDDHLTSPDFIRFMNKALEYYRNDSKIWSVTGFTMDLKRLKRYKKDVYIGCRGCCWGWGTWKDRWDKVDWKVSDYDEFINNKKRIKEFNKGGRDMTPMLKQQHEGKIHSWAIRWCYQQYKEGMLTIFPKNSKVVNIGIDGSGTNCGTGEVYKSTLKSEEQWNFEYDETDNWVYKEQKDYYSLLLLRQKLGACWYALTEYEYCLAYTASDGKTNSVLKPKFMVWYTNPVPFTWNGKQYIFMLIFNKITGRRVLGVSEIKGDGTFTRPRKTNVNVDGIQSFYMFVYKEQVYIALSVENKKEIFYFVMDHNVLAWKKCDALSYIEDMDDIIYKGGNIYEENGKLYRAMSNSSSEADSKFVIITEIIQIREKGFEERIVKKLGIVDIKAKLAQFIYRKCGVCSYGKNLLGEVACLRVQRFSIGGLFMKMYRILNKRV